MNPQPLPWYRHRWPWIIIAGPAIVVVASFATLALAIVSDDGLVADDYYQQGLAINRVIARDEAASKLGISATLRFNEERDRVRVTLAGASLDQPPRLKLIHATRAGEDQAVALVAIAPGVYEGAVKRGRAGAWRVHLEDAPGTWRLTGHWRANEPGVTLGAMPGKEGS
jgi:hypothetical protein